MPAFMEFTVFTDDTPRSHRVVTRLMDDGSFQLAILGASGALCQLVRFDRDRWDIFSTQVKELYEHGC